ncbi:GAF domain-containing protein [Streptomyces sp. SID3343]|uniref:GAF domain-containing protein n=1 Tax=Streptomyces sp. SID3343 TaxID=2690260 RepID=UPI001F26718C|nr:GAF domain-containing protein [Streptomyces sp. SID3343]
MIAAISGALADPGPDDRELLASIVGVARSIFGAAASSIFLFDRDADELVFEAVSGEGEEFLVGTRFPAHRGIAGWVVDTGESMTVDDLADSPLFAQDLAKRTRYVPNSIMAAPVVHREEILGVIQVLDPHPQSRSSIADLDLLAAFAGQAGLALHGLVRSRAARRALDLGGAEFERLAEIVRVLAELGPAQRAGGLRLVDSLHEVLSGMVR